MAETAIPPGAGETRSFEVRRLAGSLGAEIRGVDVARIGDDGFEEIARAFTDHQALILRDQNLDPERFLAFARRWGEIKLYPYMKGLAAHPQVLEILKTEADGYAFGNVWHTDGSNYRIPPRATMLYAVELPPAGGDTLVANMYAAYDTLSDGMKALLAGLRGINVGERQLSFASKISGMEKKDPGDEQVTTAHPVVRTHPETGRKALYVGHRTERFEDMTAAESAPLISYLRQHAVRPEFTCRLVWQPGSLAIWDNRCTQHYAVDDYAGHRRRMHRITIEGDEAPY